MLNLHPSEVLYCMVAANLPDQLEKIGRLRLVAHRTWTHELILWLVPLIFVGVGAHVFSFMPQAIILSHAVAFQKLLEFRTWVLFLPGLLHLAGDVMTPRGIQVATRKVSLGLFRTGETAEYVVAASFVLLAVWCRPGWIFSV
jgi:hypothetical protein